MVVPTLKRGKDAENQLLLGLLATYSSEPRLEYLRSLQLAFPHGFDSPPEGFESANPFRVSLNISLEFLPPIRASRLRRIRELALPMSVPKAPIYENNGFPFPENNVWTSGKRAIVSAKAKSHSVQHRSDL